MKKKIIAFMCVLLSACAGYKSPDRSSWPTYLRGASLTDMTETAKIAKKPIYLGSGGRTIVDAVDKKPELDYGDKSQNESAIIIGYMSELEYKLYDALRRPGVSVQRAGTDVVIILVRDAIIELDAPEISEEGDDNLGKIADILKKYDATFIEIAGYTDSMRDATAAHALSLDMAQRVAVYLAEHDVKQSRMFVVGRGAARPIAGQDEWGRLTNRRVEIRLTPVR
ncbi:MAG: OmpA family protein [Alphaproteobacteria bacterium]|nr:OmpA family protein [Alphaproteobacteria bacterium]